MSPATHRNAQPVPGWMLKEVGTRELTQPWHSSDAAAGEH